MTDEPMWRHDDECSPEQPCARCEVPWGDERGLRAWYKHEFLTRYGGANGND